MRWLHYDKPDRNDHTDGGLLIFHDPDLDRGGVCPEQDATVFLIRLFNEKRVLHVASRMVRREVQGGEIVPVVFNLRALSDFKAIAFEHFGDQPLGLSDRVEAPLW